MKKTIMEWGKEQGTTNSPSLDIIIPEKDYTKRNVRFISNIQMYSKVIEILQSSKNCILI